MFAVDKALIFNSEKKMTDPKTDVISFKPDVANATGSSCDTRRIEKSLDAEDEKFAKLWRTGWDGGFS